MEAIAESVRRRGLDASLVAAYAGVEIMRRLIGVAQLAVTYDLDRKRALLEHSRRLVLEPQQGLAMSRRSPLLFAACALAAALVPLRAAPAPVPVWIDTDPAIGEPERDVDDGLALVQAFHSPELDIRGVSVVFGNAPLDRGLPIARRLVRQFGPPRLGVFSGAAKASDPLTKPRRRGRWRRRCAVRR